MLISFSCPFDFIKLKSFIFFCGSIYPPLSTRYFTTLSWPIMQATSSAVHP